MSYTVKEFAKFWGMSQDSVHNMIAAGTLEITPKGNITAASANAVVTEVEVKPLPLSPPVEHVLYRFYGDNHRLLYVGITSGPRHRFNGHASTQPWWPDVYVITLRRYKSRKALCRAEIAAIRNEKPLHNKTYSTERVVVQPQGGLA